MKVEEIKLAFQTNVQFALADDLKQAIDFLNKATASVNNSIKVFDAAYKNMQTESNGAKSVAATQQKLINTVEAKAKELGVAPSSIPNYAEVNKAWNATQAAIDKVNEF
jgi:hypothetical protein